MLWRWMDIRHGAYRERVVVWADGPARSPILPRRVLACSRGVAAASGPVGGSQLTASASWASPWGADECPCGGGGAPKNAPRRRRRCPRSARSSLAGPEAPHVRDKRSRVRRLLEEAGRPHSRGLPVLALALLRDLHGVVQGLDEPQIAVHGVPLFGAPGLRYIEFVGGDTAIFVFGEGRTES